MSVFPTQYSLLSTSALKDHLALAYGLGEVSCRLLIHNVSDTYILEDTGHADKKYIFKLYRDMHRNYEEICGEVELLNLLKKEVGNVSYPLSDLQGKQIQQFQAAEGIRNGILFSYAEGAPVYNLNEEQLRTVGMEMAALHNITSEITLSHKRMTYDFKTTLEEPLAVIADAFKDMPEALDFLKDTSAKVIRKIEQFDLPAFSYGYCHYDFLPKNFHFNASGEVTFFDFDFSGIGYLANDIMTFYIHFFFQKEYARSTEEQADKDFNTFIEAYRTVRALSDEEIEAIPYLGFMFWMFYLGFYFKNYEDLYNVFLTPKFINDRIALIKKWTALCKFGD